MKWQMRLYDEISRFLGKGGVVFAALVVFFAVAIVVALVAGGNGGSDRSSGAGTSGSSSSLERVRPSTPSPSSATRNSTPTRPTTGTTHTSYGYIRNRDGAKHYNSLSACINHNMSPAEHAGAESNASTIAYCEALKSRGFVK